MSETHSHFNACPEVLRGMISAREDIRQMMLQISAHQYSTGALRPRLCWLLSELSADIYEFLATENSGFVVVAADPIKFVPYSPDPGSSANAGQQRMPRILGVRPLAYFGDDDRVDGIDPGTNFPLRCIETFVVDEELRIPESPEWALGDYASGFMFQNPDRAGIYCLDLLNDGFRAYYADSWDIREGSTLWAWDDEGLNMLMSYVYSLYDPPAHHYLRDPTMVWHGKSDRDMLSIHADGEVFPDVACIFTENPGNKRTGVFLAGRQPTRQAIIKDCYRPVDDTTGLSTGGFLEATLLKRIHRHGFVPGVIRLAHEEIVRFGAEGQTLIYNGCEVPHVKHRMVLADVGESLLRAESVNDLLMAVYDVLEVHRTLATRAKVLHRDMSLNNILMYPRWAQATNAQVLKGIPPFIDDVLGSEARAPEERSPRCLLIDFDLAVDLDALNAPEELRERAGTGMYVARAAAVGHVVFARHTPLRMPELSEAALGLYVNAYGYERLNRYNDDEECTFHGGIADDSGEDAWASGNKCREIDYRHRWEYDVESVYWTMYSVLLRVLPQGYFDEENTLTYNTLRQYWRILRSHEFLRRRGEQECENLPADTRTPLLDCATDAFVAPFPPVMLDVARLLFEIAQHVRIPYAAMAVPPRYDDHLHEAVQRLILNYLVRHASDPIWLTPGRLRAPQLESQVKERVLQGPDAYLSGEETGATDASVDNLWEGTTEEGSPRVSPLLTGTWSYPYFDLRYEHKEPSQLEAPHSE